MFKKIILAIMVLTFLASAGLVFSQEEDADGKERQMRRGQARRLEQDRPVARPSWRGVGPIKQRRVALASGLDRWLVELTEAYRLKDDERMEQLLRRMNQARQEMRQRGQRFGPGEKGFREGEGARMRRGKSGQAGPRVDRMERLAPPMRGRSPARRPRRDGGGQRMGRRQGVAIGGLGRGMYRGGQGLRRVRRMLRFREQTGEYFGDIGRRAWRER